MLVLFTLLETKYRLNLAGEHSCWARFAPQTQHSMYFPSLCLASVGSFCTWGRCWPKSPSPQEVSSLWDFQMELCSTGSVRLEWCSKECSKKANGNESDCPFQQVNPWSCICCEDLGFFFKQNYLFLGRPMWLLWHCSLDGREEALAQNKKISEGQEGELGILPLTTFTSWKMISSGRAVMLTWFKC